MVRGRLSGWGENGGRDRQTASDAKLGQRQRADDDGWSFQSPIHAQSSGRSNVGLWREARLGIERSNPFILGAWSKLRAYGHHCFLPHKRLPGVVPMILLSVS